MVKPQSHEIIESAVFKRFTDLRATFKAVTLPKFKNKKRDVYTHNKSEFNISKTPTTLTNVLYSERLEDSARPLIFQFKDAVTSRAVNLNYETIIEVLEQLKNKTISQKILAFNMRQFELAKELADSIKFKRLKRGIPENLINALQSDQEITPDLIAPYYTPDT